MSGRCLSFILPFGRFYEELKEKSSLSLYLLPFTFLSLLSPSLYPSPFHFSLSLLSPSFFLSLFYLSLSLFSLSFSLAYLMDVFVIVNNIKYDLKGHMWPPHLSRVVLKISDLLNITTLTYVLMDNLCPIFF